MERPASVRPSFEEALVGERISAEECKVIFSFVGSLLESSKESYFDPVLARLNPAYAANSFEFVVRVAESVRLQQDNTLSIDDLAAAILLTGNKESYPDNDARLEFRRAVFASVGYLTLLYLPKIPGSLHELQLDIPRLPSVPETTIPSQQAERQIQRMLKNFGDLFPSPTEAINAEECLYTTRLNYSSLVKVSNVRIEWVDVLSAHLHFDASTKTLMIFRLPSFCVLHLRRLTHDTVFHRILKDFNSNPLDDQLKQKRTQNFLNEVLLSYRLMFGQDPSSRALFKKREYVRAAKDGIKDPLLWKICGTKQADLTSLDVAFTLASRGVYSAGDDFPLFGQRLLEIQSYNMRQDPKTLSEFWADRRNPFNFYTFWAVIIVSLISVILSIIQCGLSVGQLIVAVRQSAGVPCTNLLR